MDFFASNLEILFSSVRIYPVNSGRLESNGVCRTLGSDGREETNEVMSWREKIPADLNPCSITECVRESWIEASNALTTHIRQNFALFDEVNKGSPEGRSRGDGGL